MKENVVKQFATLSVGIAIVLIVSSVLAHTEDSRTFTSSYESKDGGWVRIVEVAFRRKAGNGQESQP